MVPLKLARMIMLRRFTTLGVGGQAELWEVNGASELREACQEPYLILGGGSNLLVSDAGVRERVIKLGQAYNTLGMLSTPDVWLGAATPLPGLVRRAANLGLSGLEGLLGIPATLGGAVRMNAGTRYGCIGDVLQEVEIFLDGGFERIGAEALALGYRRSALPREAIITRARLRLSISTSQKVEALMMKVDAARSCQPRIKSAGCAFKNPPGTSAGKVIDESGLKGLRVGQAMIACEHANFIVNLGGATAEDICRLLDLIRARAQMPLELEWHLWGF